MEGQQPQADFAGLKALLEQLFICTPCLGLQMSTSWCEFIAAVKLITISESSPELAFFDVPGRQSIVCNSEVTAA